MPPASLWGGGGAVCCRYTYEIAPVFVLMEEVVLQKLRELVGWGSGDGIFCPGVPGLAGPSSPSSG